MADRPIIFSGPMVLALIAGTKTQTRRILKPQPPTPEEFPGSVFGLERSVADGVKVYSLNDLDRLPKHPTKWDLCGSVGVARDAGFPMTYRAPFAVGDRLWVRETWAHDGPDLATVRAAFEDALGGAGYGPYYRATETAPDTLIWRSPIHMPHWASRLTLDVTEVRVQRLQDISEADAIAEGATMRPTCSGFRQQRDGWSMDWSRVGRPSKFARTGVLSEADVSLGSAREAFGAFINELHDPRWNLKGDGIWGENPWCAAISFSVTPANIDSLPETNRDA